MSSDEYFNRDPTADLLQVESLPVITRIGENGEEEAITCNDEKEDIFSRFLLVSCGDIEEDCDIHRKEAGHIYDEFYHRIMKKPTNTRHILFIRLLKHKYRFPETFCDEVARIRSLGNAGGNSFTSELLAIDFLVRFYKAQNVISENEVEYRCRNCPMLDCIVDIDDIRFGVSVTQFYNIHGTYDRATVDPIIRKKLNGLVASREHVADKHQFYNSILVVWVKSVKAEDKVTKAFVTLVNNNKDYDGISILILNAGSRFEQVVKNNILT
jgi:hypothetical protein